jgi:HEPN domain-containing protein
MGIENDLNANIEEFLESAEADLAKGRYNSAVSSYFKAIATLCDLKIYELRRVLPKNHSERFLFLKISFPSAYKIVSGLFNEYTKTYNLRLGKKDALLFKENAKKIREILERKA